MLIVNCKFSSFLTQALFYQELLLFDKCCAVFCSFLINCILVVTVLLFLLYFFFDIVVAFIILKLQPIKMLLFELFLLIVSCSHRTERGI